MQHASRWLVAVAASAIGFSVAWRIADYGRLETQSAIGVATVVATLILTPLGFWASKKDLQPEPLPVAVQAGPGAATEDRPGGSTPILVGDIPGEAVAWQERDHLLDRLCTLAGSGRLAVVCAVTGQRGIGKTQLAAAYARRRAADGWPVMAWIVADTDLGLLTGLDQLAAAARVRPPTADLDSSAAAALAWLRVQPGPCLLVYDNAVDPDLIRRYTPAVGAVQTVVTTTDRAFANAAREQVVQLLGVLLRQLNGVHGFATAVTVGPVWVAELERVLGPGHPNTMASRNNLARAFREVGRLDEAIRLHTRTLADAERMLGPDHHDTLVMRNSLAATYRLAGRLDEMIELCTNTQADSERVLGPHHPDTLASRHNLATAYWSVGRFDEGIELCSQIVADRERLLGPVHPDTLASRNSLAAAYRVAGRLDEATALYTRILADAGLMLGPDHPDTLSSQHSLALGYRLAGRLDDAIELFTRALKNSERALGPDHPDTLILRTNLAYVYQDASRLDEAIALHARTLADSERVLGPDHQDTFTARNGLAAAYQEAGGWTRRSSCTPAPWPTPSGCSARTTRTPSTFDRRWPTPTGRRASWTERSISMHAFWPTLNEYLARTTRTPSPSGTASPPHTGRRDCRTRPTQPATTGGDNRDSSRAHVKAVEP